MPDTRSFLPEARPAVRGLWVVGALEEPFVLALNG